MRAVRRVKIERAVGQQEDHLAHVGRQRQHVHALAREPTLELEPEPGAAERLNSTHATHTIAPSRLSLALSLDISPAAAQSAEFVATAHRAAHSAHRDHKSAGTTTHTRSRTGTTARQVSKSVAGGALFQLENLGIWRVLTRRHDEAPICREPHAPRRPARKLKVLRVIIVRHCTSHTSLRRRYRVCARNITLRARQACGLCIGSPQPKCHKFRISHSAPNCL